MQPKISQNGFRVSKKAIYEFTVYLVWYTDVRCKWHYYYETYNSNGVLMDKVYVPEDSNIDTDEKMLRARIRPIKKKWKEYHAKTKIV